MFNATNFSTHEGTYPGIHCMMINSESYKYCILIGYSFICLIPTSIGFYAIVCHYCKLEKDLLLSLRICSILATLCFILFDLDTIVDFYFAMECDSTESFWIKYDRYGNIFFVVGYLLLYLIFVLKLKYSFKDSIFEVSRLQMNIIIIIGIIDLILAIVLVPLMMINNIFYLTDQVFLLFFGIASIFYFIGNILLSYQMFSRLYNYIQFVKNAGQDENLTNDINEALYHAFVRLIVVYTCAILSSVLLVCMILILSFVATINVVFANQWGIWYRIILLADHTVNICCLLCQHDSATHFFEHICCLCSKCANRVLTILTVRQNVSYNDNMKKGKLVLDVTCTSVHDCG